MAERYKNRKTPKGTGKGGNKTKAKEAALEKAELLQNQGLSDVEIAAKLRLTRETVGRYVKELQERKNLAESIRLTRKDALSYHSGALSYLKSKILESVLADLEVNPLLLHEFSLKERLDFLKSLSVTEGITIDKEKSLDGATDDLRDAIDIVILASRRNKKRSPGRLKKAEVEEIKAEE